MKSNEILEKLHGIDRECHHLEKVSALLQWDQETYLPPGGEGERSGQLALIQSLAHERFTAPETGRLLEELGSVSDNPRGDESLPSLERDFLRVMRRNYDKAVKLPVEFVASCVRSEALSQAAWVQARRNNDFAAFLPHLNTVLEAARKKAGYWGYPNGEGATLYDGLLDIYEPDMKASDITRVFTPLRERLSALLGRIAAKGQRQVPFLKADFAPEVQARYNQALIERLGFDTSRGRLDVSAHPFTTSLGANDIRITTRYGRNNLLSSIFSTIHESGHAFYEMGFPSEMGESCLADGASMAVHESQSRFWENVIGRSRPFWKAQLPALKAFFPEQLAMTGLDDFYRAVNQVSPSLIRVEADEVSYSLHIILRFELEKELFSGELAAEDLPAAWRRRMKEFIGIENETDADGVLQDVHWSMGAFGYFPSYALGNLYGLQIRQKLIEDIPDYETKLAEGSYKEIHAWLKERIYVWGKRLSPQELLFKITGERLSVEPFLNYIENKYTELYEC
ncbi:MAG: carboxypeptidase M32 [Treponema sp.]|jgi:carboxypeptidase Taq|nr:carboxypeptidase M32 [Treponema sp.]